MKVKDIMTGETVFAEVPGSTSEALNLIIKNGVSGLPVVKRGTNEVLGIVTREDLLKTPDEPQLGLLMTGDVVTIHPDEDIKKAANIFLNASFRRLPVVDKGKLLGIVTISDIVWRGIEQLGLNKSIDTLISPNITAVWEETPLNVASEIMGLSKYTAVPVLGPDGKLSGMVSDMDLLKGARLTESTKKSEMSASTEGDKWGWDSKNVIYITKKTLELPDKIVKDVMIKNVITATKKTSISECARKMAKNRVEQIPVIDAEGNMIGVVRDLTLLETI
jgi:CBS domain-containing protein|tara:strand:+ start:1923 stop:2753 length:831 start_codon:yes stop_codon:yes gene_type:complete